MAALGGYNPTTSDSYLLPVFAAVFLGTAIIEPGRFNPIGTFIGIYFLETGILGLQLLGLQAWVSPVFYGGVLVVAVTISTLLRRRTPSRLSPVVLRVVGVLPGRIRHRAVRLSWGAVPVMITCRCCPGRIAGFSHLLRYLQLLPLVRTDEADERVVLALLHHVQASVIGPLAH